jgi:serine/threonine protein kinase
VVNTREGHHAQKDEFIGKRVGGFLVKQLLGHGGMGKVYEAVQVSVGRPVALKVLKSSLQHDDRLHKRFAREAQAIAQLNHPNIVTLYDFGVDDLGASYIAMEFVDGKLLTQYLRKPPSVEFAVHVFCHILRALQCAHARGIIHRDLKPDNVMLTTVGNDEYFAKVLDFGLARLTDPDEQNGERSDEVQLTHAGEVFGTPLYMSPEQASGEQNIGKTSDIYSLGCMMYELISGSPPFIGHKAMHVLMKHVHDDAPMLIPRREFAHISPQFIDIVMWCLVKAPQDRPQSAEQLLNSLDATPEAAFMTASRSEIHPIIVDDDFSPDFDLESYDNAVDEILVQSSPSLAHHLHHTMPGSAAGATPRPVSLLPQDLIPSSDLAVVMDSQVSWVASQDPELRTAMNLDGKLNSRPKPNRAPMLIALTLLLAASGAALWFFTRPSTEAAPHQTSAVNPPPLTNNPPPPTTPQEPKPTLALKPQNPALDDLPKRQQQTHTATRQARLQLNRSLDLSFNLLQEKTIAQHFHVALATKGKNKYKPKRSISYKALLADWTWDQSLYWRHLRTVNARSYAAPEHLLFGNPP